MGAKTRVASLNWESLSIALAPAKEKADLARRAKFVPFGASLPLNRTFILGKDKPIMIGRPQRYVIDHAYRNGSPGGA